MKYAVLLFLIYSTASFSCALDPIRQTTKQAEWGYEQADYVFLGKIISFDDLQEYKQIVTFLVQKTFKGPELISVTIVNRLHSSCSRALLGKGNSYYVFSKLGSDGSYTVGGAATFIPLKMANEYELNLEKAHNQWRNSDSGANAPTPVR